MQLASGEAADVSVKKGLLFPSTAMPTTAPAPTSATPVAGVGPFAWPPLLVGLAPLMYNVEFVPLPVMWKTALAPPRSFTQTLLLVSTARYSGEVDPPALSPSVFCDRPDEIGVDVVVRRGAGGRSAGGCGDRQHGVSDGIDLGDRPRA